MKVNSWTNAFVRGGKHFGDAFARWRGGYGFMITLAVFLAVWIAWNLVPFLPHWDSEGFFTLNLLLSIEASFAMPVLLMAQRKETLTDRSLMQRGLATDLDIDERVKQIQHDLDDLEGQIIRLAGYAAQAVPVNMLETMNLIDNSDATVSRRGG